MPEIRALVADDALDDLLALSRAFFAEYEAHHASFFQIDQLVDGDIRSYFERWLASDDGETIIALEGERIVGYVTVYVAAQPAYWQVKQVGHISGLMVATSHRRRGIATQLLAAAMAFFQRKSVRYYTVHTAAENHTAQRFYQRCGMTPLAVTLLGDVESASAPLPDTPAARPDGATILPSLPVNQFDAAAALLLAAFPQKLAAMIGRGPQAAPALATCLRPEQWLAAMADGRLVGLCGLSVRRRRCLQASWASLCGVVGCWRALQVRLGVAFGHRAVPADALYVDQLAVAADARGKGLGARLLAEAAALARQQGYDRLMLDVVDTNPRTRALYERLGFAPIKTQRIPFMRRWLGFSAVTLMALDLA